MLSTKSFPVIEATLPIIAERISSITPNFYNRLFTAHPELLDGIFSRSNQKNGTQQQALAGSIAVFATYLVKYPNTTPETMLARVAHKHTSLGVVEEQYPIVYKHLFDAIAEDLGDALTPEIAEAWTEVYWLMAHALVKIEKGLYAQQANAEIYAPWKLVERTETGLDSVVFSFEPADETPVTVAKPGQFVSVRMPMADGIRQVRQYTLSNDIEHASRRTITVKLDVNGEFSPVIHNDLKIGDVVELSNPYGDLVVENDGSPLVIATAGIGCTPSAAALQTLAANGSNRKVTVLHADQEFSAWPLREQMLESVSILPEATISTWFERGELPEGLNAKAGYMDLTEALTEDAQVYLCGPLPFMNAVRNQALEAGVPAERIHYEVFGPDVWLAA
ncbi:globin domain-containing protein [Arthrobacter sp. NIO-1057]|uniref:globin domain-containing protein n=1 Tax=Arthrobacter sp. NIO-1057 TaxID=993071 RepID=UPI00071D4534|nr:globin domain-containing protein [Arthrobacter sp. NIO-1057]KSU65733.1 hemin transporter [Arthrobacter sp. NIO-1057]SCC41658.1 nitric oxide dioxygenase [Arthrobacter sp. NIO-1057]